MNTHITSMSQRLVYSDVEVLVDFVRCKGNHIELRIDVDHLNGDYLVI